MKLLILLGIILLLTNQAQAKNFGLGPCCSGAPCGIVPCDKKCAGNAFNNFGISTEKGIQVAETGFSQNAQSLERLQSEYQSFFSKLNKAEGNYHETLSESITRYYIGFQAAKVGGVKQNEINHRARVASLRSLLTARKKLLNAGLIESDSGVNSASAGVAKTLNIVSSHPPIPSQLPSLELNNIREQTSSQSKMFVSNYIHNEQGEIESAFRKNIITPKQLKKANVLLSHSSLSERQKAAILKVMQSKLEGKSPPLNQASSMLLTMIKDTKHIEGYGITNSSALKKEEAVLKQINLNHLSSILKLKEVSP